MKLTILGCYAATPRTFTNPTSQVVEFNNSMYLIDCGEGTQVQLRRNKIKFSRINQIFISHLHGDHFYGLIGLISSFGLLGRQNDLHIYGPKGIKEVMLLQLKLSNSYTQYKLYFHELTSKSSELIFEDNKVQVYTIPLNHRIYTNGYLFVEKITQKKLNIQRLEELDIHVVYYNKIKNGEDHTLEDGTVISNEELTYPPKKSFRYAYCSDTMYEESIIPIIKEADVLYHESTFLEHDKPKTEYTKHSTAKEAATIAKLSDVRKLILGHYSTRYPDISVFEDEAKTVFDKVLLADDGKIFEF